MLLIKRNILLVGIAHISLYRREAAPQCITFQFDTTCWFLSFYSYTIKKVEYVVNPDLIAKFK